MEVDLTNTLIPCVRLIGHVRKVEYISLHIICFNCGKYGHRLEYCPQVIQTPPSENRSTEILGMGVEEFPKVVQNHVQLMEPNSVLFWPMDVMKQRHGARLALMESNRG